jgi:hypothetical protein
MGIPKKPKGHLNEETTQLGETTLQIAAMQQFYIDQNMFWIIDKNKMDPDFNLRLGPLLLFEV